MKAFVKIMVGTFESVDAFKATDLWAIIDEVHSPSALDVEVMQGSGNRIAVIVSNADSTTAESANTDCETAIRPKILERIGKSGNVASRLTFNSQAELDAWKASF